MRAPKLFKQNKEVLYNITEMQTKIRTLIVRSKFKPLIFHHSLYYN